MDTVVVELHVDSEGRITGRAPLTLASGDYRATSAPESNAPSATKLFWQVHDPEPWPDDLSLRREDLYGEDGR
jgi:hypothetical protein